MKKHIYLSYSHDVEMLASLIRSKLKQHFEVWEDNRRPSIDWRQGIDSAISESFAVIVLMTPKSSQSPYVIYEWAFAMGIGIRVIPLLAGEVHEIHPKLNAMQYLDFSGMTDRDSLMTKLVEQLSHCHRDYIKYSKSVELEKKIFISYRRADSQDVAGRIYDALSTKYTRDSIFKDVDNIPVGSDFADEIVTYMSESTIVLVLIGDKWLHIRDVDGNRRLEIPDDFVRVEIETAIRSNKVVIPVLLGDTEVPSQRELPDSLHGMLTKNVARVRPDPDFHRDMERLLNSITDIILE